MVKSVNLDDIFSKMGLIEEYKRVGVVNSSGGNWDAFEEDLLSYNVVGEPICVIHGPNFDMSKVDLDIYKDIISGLDQQISGDASKKIEIKWSG